MFRQKQPLRSLLIMLMVLACGSPAARELVHPFPATGPAEVAGAVPASKMLRTMQRYTMPAFTDAMALHVASVLQGPASEQFTVVRKPRQAGNEAARYVAAAAPDGHTLLFASAASDAVSRGARARLQAIAAVATMP